MVPRGTPTPALRELFAGVKGVYDGVVAELR
jgi:hypothetical protein